MQNLGMQPGSDNRHSWTVLAPRPKKDPPDEEDEPPIKDPPPQEPPKEDPPGEDPEPPI